MTTFESASAPEPFDVARAERTFEALAADGFIPAAAQRRTLAAAFGNSPFLARLALREHALLTDRLRSAKRHAALAIALGDIAGILALEDVTRSLTEFADAAVKGALRFVLHEAAEREAVSREDGATLEASTGLTILAMGKYGAFELNYSSDIDLVVFYDPRRFPFRKRDDARGAAVDLVRGIVKLLSEITADGYVFRVDLRLRPDAGATQVAISVDAAESYYEGMGQNWERAAFIKA